MRRAVTIELFDSERVQLSKLVKGRRTPGRLVERARIVLLAADGMESQLIAAEVGVAWGTVQRWRKHYAANRFAGIEKNLPCGGRTPRQLQNHASRIVEATLHEKTSGGDPLDDPNPRVSPWYKQVTGGTNLGDSQSAAPSVLVLNQADAVSSLPRSSGEGPERRGSAAKGFRGCGSAWR